ncbi:MAG: hypothetical protein MJ157_02810 [Clostridia bacterium]|nr:hypothetical protein [Clostridia bacterium]
MARGETYEEFVNKFKHEKTTDDCFTPELVYDVVADYAAETYQLDRKNFIRPFWPGEDYQARKYLSGEIVVDNPPFSILAQIIRYFLDKEIKFFLFSPHLTLFSNHSCSCIVTGNSITFTNGAKVAISFLTNLENCQFRTDLFLYQRIQSAQNKKSVRRSLTKHNYPQYVVTATRLSALARTGIDFCVQKNQCQFIRRLDSQKAADKAIFGGGFLLNEPKAAEYKKMKDRVIQLNRGYYWPLSERELAIVKHLKGDD